VSRLKAILGSSAAVCVLLTASTTSRAEEVEKKFRLAFSVGDYATGNKVHSAAANRRTLFLPDGQIEDLIYDPRNDSGAAANFGIESQLGGVLSASYAVSRFWYVEASVGYRTGTVGNVMVQAQFNGIAIPNEQDFNFGIYNLDGGTMEQIPIEFTAGIRFRPKAAFNPYLCAGIGYTFVSYSPSDEINQFSLNLDQSTGGFGRLSGTLIGGEHLESAGVLANLTGMEVDVPDAPEWHVGGGFEYTFKSRWAFFVDARYYTYSGKFGMTVNGGDQLGISVPNDRVFVNDPGAFGPFGAVQVTTGGLIDGGSSVPTQTAPPGTDCSVPGNPNCAFTGPPDGIPDPGFYYVQVGKVRYNGASLQIGVKFTF
jgi:opacity protein-like surface antigen